MSNAANIYSNVLGQQVDISNPANASGYYVATDQAVEAQNNAGTNRCPPGMRPGRMIIKGLPATENTPGGYLNTCAGQISQEDLPDIHVIDWKYRIYIDIVLVILVLIMVGAIALKVVK